MRGHSAGRSSHLGSLRVLPPDHPQLIYRTGAFYFQSITTPQLLDLHRPAMNPVLKQSDLVTPERVQLSIRSRFNPLPALKPQLLGTWLESFRLGFFRNAALTWDAIERRLKTK